MSKHPTAVWEFSEKAQKPIRLFHIKSTKPWLAKPLITAATKASTYYLKNGKHSILIPPGNPRALAEAIRNLKNDPALAIRIGRNGRLLYEKQFSNQVIVDKLQNLLDTL